MSNGNQPAFSHTAAVRAGGYTVTESSSGLTKREAFAMAAMQGLCSNPSTYENPHAEEDEIAHWAVRQADALLAELEKLP